MKRGNNVLIEGFKAFNSNKTNRYGMSFDEGKAYHASGEISFGNDGNGFHICKHLSDVFRFFDSEDVIVARVIGSGEIVEAELHDWTEPYIEMYAVSDLYVDSFLNREEIINEMKKASSSDVIKFFATYNVKEDEALQILRSNKVNTKKIIGIDEVDENVNYGVLQCQIFKIDKTKTKNGSTIYTF
jgi:hypothetical protein